LQAKNHRSINSKVSICNPLLIITLFAVDWETSEGRVEKTSEQKKALKHRITVYDEGQ